MEKENENEIKKEEKFTCKMDINLLWYPSFLRDDLAYI